MYKKFFYDSSDSEDSDESDNTISDFEDDESSEISESDDISSDDESSENDDSSDEEENLNYNSSQPVEKFKDPEYIASLRTKFPFLSDYSNEEELQFLEDYENYLEQQMIMPRNPIYSSGISRLASLGDLIRGDDIIAPPNFDTNNPMVNPFRDLRKGIMQTDEDRNKQLQQVSKIMQSYHK